MGHPGVPLDLPREKIENSIKKHKGVLTYVCEELDIARSTIHKIINNDKGLQLLLSEMRHEYDELICDLGEHVLISAMKGSDKDMTSALSASKYALNNKARHRGYSPIPVNIASEPSEPTVKVLTQMDNANGTDPVPEAIDELSRGDG